MRRKWSRLLGISLTSALAVSCAAGADDAASQGAEDVISGKSSALDAKLKAENFARKALSTTKISSQLSSKVREAFKAGQGHEMLVQLNVSAQLKGAERVAAIKGAQEAIRSALGKGAEITRADESVPFATVRVSSEEALDQLLANDSVSAVREQAKLVPMAAGDVQSPAASAAYLNQSQAATALGVPVSTLGSRTIAATSCANSTTNGGFEADLTSWTVDVPSAQVTTFSPHGGTKHIYLADGGSVTQELGTIDSSSDLDVSVYIGIEDTLAVDARVELSACDTNGCTSLGFENVNFVASTASDIDWRQTTVAVDVATLVGHEGKTLELTLANVSDGSGLVIYFDDVTACDLGSPASTERAGVAGPVHR